MPQEEHVCLGCGRITRRKSQVCDRCDNQYSLVKCDRCKEEVSQRELDSNGGYCRWCRDRCGYIDLDDESEDE